MQHSLDGPGGAPARRPHVLYVTPIFGYPPMGGPRLRTYNTLRAVSRCADVSLYLVDVPDTPDPSLARQHVLTFCREVYWPEPAPSPRGLARVLRGGARRLFPKALRSMLRAPYGALRGTRAGRRGDAPPADATSAQLASLAEWVEAHTVDVVWLGFGSLLYHLAPLKEITGRRLVIETESVWSRFLLRSLPFETDPQRRAEIERQGREKEAQERWGTSYADVTSAVSRVEAAYYQGLIAEKDRVMLLANVIDVDAYESDPQDAGVKLQAPAVCFPGTMSQGTANVDAGLWLLDEVMPRVWDREPDVHVYLVGRHPAPALLARRSPRVHVTGEVHSVVPYLRQSVATVVPLRWESGTRFKILEAFACRTPVVSTELGAEGLEVESGRHLLLADTAPQFAEGLLSLVRQPELRARLAREGYELVRREYDLSSAERQVRAILARLGFAEATAGTASEGEVGGR